MVFEWGKEKQRGGILIPTESTSKRIIQNIHSGWGPTFFPEKLAISEQKFNQHLKFLQIEINFPTCFLNKVGRRPFGTGPDRIGNGGLMISG